MKTTLNILPAAAAEQALHIIREVDPEGASPRFISHEVLLALLALQARLGTPWRFMPHKSTLLARRRRWIEQGVFDALLSLSLAEPNEVSYVDCTFIECKSPHPERGWTKIGNGLKIQAICRDDRQIVAARVSCASPGEGRLLEALLREQPDLPIQWLVGDAAYDALRTRVLCAARGAHLITTNDGPRRTTGSLDDPWERRAARHERGVIERVFARLKDWRAVATCYCRSAATYGAALALAVASLNGRLG